MTLLSPVNVGRADRVVRIALGGIALGAPTALGAGVWLVVPMGVLGVGTALSGVLGRCSIYHALGIDSRRS